MAYTAYGKSESVAFESLAVGAFYILYYCFNRRSLYITHKICIYMKTKGCECKPLIG